ncbi:MAG: phospholipase D-like domain-containing protein [Planctomycetota bacterium]
MQPEELQSLLRQSLEDLLLSRGERQALRQVLEELAPAPNQIAQLRQMIFETAREKVQPRDSGLVLDWLEDLMKLLQAQGAAEAEVLSPESHFSPDEGCPQRIIQLIGAVRTELDICVFTITDDRLAAAILEAHARGVRLRIITDNEKAFDLGSDVTRLQEAGVPLKVDQTPFHMHHKFALFDRQLLLTGSYNWTRGAARDNQENFIVTSERRLVDPFQDVFERLWRTM